jgi:sugar (pentulose or hexulose) kinase
LRLSRMIRNRNRTERQGNNMNRGNGAEVIAQKYQKLRDIFPKVLSAGEQAGFLTEEGAAFLMRADSWKREFALSSEGDAGTGMVATNSVAVRTGNVSAGTSTFAMIVLEKPLRKLHREIDMVTTPTGYSCLTQTTGRLT